MTPTKEVSIETIERIIELIQEGNSQSSETLVVPCQLCLKFAANMKEMGRLKKKTYWYTVKDIKTSG